MRNPSTAKGLRRFCLPFQRGYTLHIEELIRFRRYVSARLLVRPALPSGAAARMFLPDGFSVQLTITAAAGASLLTAEFVAETGGLKVHEATVELTFGRKSIRFPQIGTSCAARDPWQCLTEEFRAYCRTLRNRRVLEIGSRVRDDTQSFFSQDAISDPSVQYLGFDILPGENVDVVGDAHCLSSYFEPASFDLVCSEWVFEHLIMPWRVVLEINKVLKPGGEVWINTNHSMALHDMPWDFWRFSDTAWIGLFNEFTGFEIKGTALGVPVRLTPMRYNDSFRDHERGLGFQSCCVWARKTGPARVDWPADAAAILAPLASAYPEQIKADAETVEQRGPGG